MKKKLILCSALALCIFGISTTVKAESYIVDSAPDKFTTKDAGRGYENGQLTKTENDAVLSNVAISALGQNVIDYHTKDNKKVFCIDRKITYAPNKEYTRTSETVDYPIVYMIVNSEKYYKELGVDGVTADNQKMEQSWLTQIAIWLYNSQKDDNDKFERISDISNDIHEGGLDAMTGSDYYYYSKRANNLWIAAGKLVEAAKKATDPSSVSNLNFRYEAKNELDKENKTVKTSLISLYTDNVSTYSINLSNAPAGTKAYAENGTEITDLNNVTVKSFYLVIPIENVDNYTYDFNITAKTTGYSYYKGYKYVNEGNQPLALVTRETKPLDVAINIKGSNIEDTGLSVVNSIYLVGFLILIAGIGVVYFNVKQKQEQE